MTNIKTLTSAIAIMLAIFTCGWNVSKPAINNPNELDAVIADIGTNIEIQPYILDDEIKFLISESSIPKAIVSIKMLDNEIEEEKYVEDIQENIYLGEFKLTAYCPCEVCCGKSDGITATGILASSGRTIAVDPNVIPYGSRVLINGHEYIAEDCGGAVNQNQVDIFFDSHQDALEFGVQYSDVYMVNFG